MNTQTPDLPHQPLILASSSPFRRELLSRLGLEFSAISPEIDESRKADETAEVLVRRLAEMKARKIAEHHPDALIIGSDQVAILEDRILGKPGSHEKAVGQLTETSGKRVSFLTGLCLLNARNGEIQISCERYHVLFRELSDRQIDAYLTKEQPYNCAGSFKSEGLGVCLFKRMEGDDPTALIGLPLIALIDMLEAQGVDVLAV